MSDLYGVASLISVYPVHLVTFLGCILLLTLVTPKRKRRRKHFSISSESNARKKSFTQEEKQLIAEKINENRMSYIKRHAEIDENSTYMIFASITLIGLSLLFMFGLIREQFQKYFLVLLLLFVIGVLLMKLYKFLILYWKRRKV